MSRQTPRKARQQQQQQPSGGGGGGYSRQQAQQYMQNSQQQQQARAQVDFGIADDDALASASDDLRAQMEHPPMESLDDMNLRVLRRYDPSILAIEAVAASSVVYAFSGETGEWVKSEPQIEGTLFLCEQEPLVIDRYVIPRACVFLLNRKGLTNVVVDLSRIGNAEAAEGLLTLSLDDEQDDDEASGPQVLGLWIHGGESFGIDGARFDPNVVVQRWQATRAVIEQNLGTSQLSETAEFLDAAATMGEMNMRAQGLDPEGLATATIGPQLRTKEVIAIILGQQAQAPPVVQVR